MNTLGRYLLLQLPSWIGVALLMALLHAGLGVSVWIGVVATVAWMLKDLLLYPLVRRAYEPRAPGSPQASLVGLVGTAEQDLDPAGFVRVRGELWQARAAAAPLPRGTRVVVRRVDGMTLFVERCQAKT